jgi:hypothetical protein
LAKTGDSASLRRLFAFLKVNERYRDVTTIDIARLLFTGQG